MSQRCPDPTPDNRPGFLHEVPTLALLDLLPIPTLAVRDDGELLYANAACAAMLGHSDTRALMEMPLPALLAGHAHCAPADCVATLKAAGSAVIAWCHAHGFLVHTVVSRPLLMRPDEPVLLITMTDVTEQRWDAAPHAGPGQPPP